MLSTDQKDKIYNALLVGMTLEDAYLYAGLSPREIELDQADAENQAHYRQVNKELEFGLLTDMRTVISKQRAQGKSEALQWTLEKLFPRYSAKPQPAVGVINLIMKKEDADDITETFDPINPKK